MRLPGPFRRSLGLKALALALATVFYVSVVLAANPPETRTVAVEVPQDRGLIPSKWVLVAPIDRIPVQIAGTREHLAQFDTRSLAVSVNFGAIDRAGDLQLPVTVVNQDRDVLVDSVPSTVRASIDELGSAIVATTIRYSSPPPPGYFSISQAADPDRVTVVGPKHALTGLEAQAMVNLGNQKTNLLQDVPLVVLAGGKPRSDLGVTPPTVRVTITIGAQATSRAVAVLPKLQGVVADGHQLGALNVDPPIVVVAGPEDLINSLDSVSTTPISIAGATGDVSLAAKLDPPDGVRATPDTVTVHVSVTTLPASGPQPAR